MRARFVDPPKDRSNTEGVTRLGYVPALNGIRGLAILLVVADHYFGLHEGGSTGVHLFFVLSGFLITTLLLEEHASSGGIRLGAFYGRRARRLLPALGVLLVVYAAIEVDRPGLGVIVERVALVGSYVSNVAVAFRFHDVISGTVLGPLWSLAQEEQFYLVWPLILIVGLRSRRLLTWLLVAIVVLVVYQRVLVLAGASSSRVYYGPDTNPLWLLAGATVALIRQRGHTVPPLVAVAATGCAVWYIGSVNLGWAWVGSTLATPLLLISYSALVAAACGSGPIVRMLSVRPVVFLGAISYSLYLWHLMALQLGSGLGVEVGLGATSWRSLSIALAIAIAWLSYRFVEQPFRLRGRRAANTRALPAAEVPAAGHTKRAAAALRGAAHREVPVGSHPG